jgi:hypothetical protein
MKLDDYRVLEQAAAANGMLFFHQGEMTAQVVEVAGRQLRACLDDEGVGGPLSRRVFSTFVEMAQNVIHYGADEGGETPTRMATIALGRSMDPDQRYWLVCSNRVQVQDIARLDEKLRAVQSMSADEIKAAYRAQLRNDAHAETDRISKGAGLGLLTIARDARAPLEYGFASEADRSAVERLVLRLQLLGRLDEVRVLLDAVGRADQLALRLVLGADAFGAAQRVDDVDRVADGDRLVRAHRLAGVAGGAVLGDHKGHGVVSSSGLSGGCGGGFELGSGLRVAEGAPQCGADGAGIDRVGVRNAPRP